MQATQQFHRATQTGNMLQRQVLEQVQNENTNEEKDLQLRF